VALQARRVAAAYQGMDADASPDYIDQYRGTLVENLLPARPGKLVMRGPLRTSYDLAGATSRDASFWTFGDKVLGAFFDGTTNQYQTVDLATGATASFTKTFGLSRKTYDRIGAYVWGTERKYGGQIVQLVRWDGGSVAGSVVQEGTLAAPRGMADVKAHYQRLFVLCGTPPGVPTDPVKKTSLLWSDAGGPVIGAVASWQDDISGLTNEIVIPGDGSEEGVALARVGRHLALLMTSSIYLLTGDTPATFAVRALTQDYGCVDVGSVVEATDGFYFLSHAGYMYCDGAQVVRVSDPVQSELMTACAATTRYVSAVRFRDNFLCLIVGSDNVVSPSAADTPLFAALLHMPTNSWVKLSTDATIFPDQIPHSAARSLRYPLLWDSRRLWKADELTLPEAAAENLRGFDNKAGTTKRIPAKWHTRLERLSTPLQLSQLNRLLVDYSFIIDGGAGNVDGWYVTAYSGEGIQLVTEYRLPSQADPSDYVTRRRHTHELFHETSDVQLRIEYKSDGGTVHALAKAELYDLTAVFEPGRLRPST